MTYDLQKPQPTVTRTPVAEVVDAVRFEGLSLRLAAIETGRTREQLKGLCWRASREDTFKRDGRRCLQCDAHADDAHHRCARGMGGTSDPLLAFGLGNLVSLCRECHTFTEITGKETGWSYAKGYAIRHPTNPTTVPVLTLQHGWVLLDHRGGITPITSPAA